MFRSVKIQTAAQKKKGVHLACSYCIVLFVSSMSHFCSLLFVVFVVHVCGLLSYETMDRISSGDMPSLRATTKEAVFLR